MRLLLPYLRCRGLIGIPCVSSHGLSRLKRSYSTKFQSMMNDDDVSKGIKVQRFDALPKKMFTMVLMFY